RLPFAHARNPAAHVVPTAQYFAAGAAGTLPAVAFIDARGFGTLNQESDEHPPANVQVGEKFVADVVQALMASPSWPRAALFLVYDEHGGYYDHVPPPPACVPDDIAPQLGPGDTSAAFDRYGVRVPFVVVSPYARRHFVSHLVHDHTAILRFIETRFDLPALTRRDANANPLLEFFDFRHAHIHPPQLPPARVDPARAAESPALVAEGANAPDSGSVSGCGEPARSGSGSSAPLLGGSASTAEMEAPVSRTTSG